VALSPALRGESPASRVRIANAWRAPGRAQAGYLEGVATGKAPPQIVAVGSPGAVPSPLVLSVSTPGALGTAVLQIPGIGVLPVTAPSDATYGRSLSPVAGYGQAAPWSLGSNAELTMFLAPGFYDASNVWTFNFGVATPPGDIIAIGLAPIDSPAQATATYQLSDAVLFRMHTASATAPQTVMLPTNPWDGMTVAVMDADGTSAQLNKTILVGATVPLQNPYNLNSTNLLLQAIGIPYQTVEWTWDAQAGFWRVTRDSAAGELPSVAVSGTGSSITGRAFVKCATGSAAVTVNLPVNPTEGMRVRVKDVQGGASSGHAITIKSAQTNVGIQEDTSIGGGLEPVPGATGVVMSAAYGCLDFTYDATATFTGGIVGIWWVTQEYLP
jgi:hypothetical protein